MNENKKARRGNKDIVSGINTDSNSSNITGILDERIHNLHEAIEEIDAALAHRKVLNVRFLEQIDREALKPYTAGEISYEIALERAATPLQAFMLRQTREKDLGLFIRLGKLPRPATRNDLPFRVNVPAFLISELRCAFQLGFVLYVPFLIIDLVVASSLLSMGMLMLPPVMISLPFKLLLFVMVDGWHLILRSLTISFS